MATENLNLAEIGLDDSAYIVPVDENFKKIDAAFGALQNDMKSAGDMKAAEYDVDADGAIDIEGGGTGATTAKEALENLGIIVQTEVPTTVEDGKIVFVVEA